ncbi:O-antigen ligase family protein [Phocaeicola sp.]
MFTLIIIMIAAAPIFNNRKIYKFRHKLFGGFSVGLTIVGVISAYLATKGWGYLNNTPWLVGLADFPNSLGYSLAVSIMLLASMIPRKKWYIKLVIIGLISLCLWAVPLTGTRTALYSLPIFCIMYVFLSSRNTKEILKTLFVICILSIAFFSLVKLDMSIIKKKNSEQSTHDNSRTTLFQGRIKEFKENPILGIGTFVADRRWTAVTKNGNVEAGNTFLMFLSMNGIIGFVNFMFLYVALLIPFTKYILRRRQAGRITSFEIFLSSIVMYNGISMLQMGILLNPGMYITGFNWLTLALMYKPHLYLRKTNPNIFIK